MNKFCLATFYIVILLSTYPVKADKNEHITIIHHPHLGDEFNQDDLYFLALLNLALESSKQTFGPYKLVSSPLPMLQQRAIAEVVDNRLDVIWTMTSPDREKQLKPVRIPTLKGLGGFRIFLIRLGDEEKFKKINNESQLKALMAGQGLYWPDSNILLDNGYSLKKVVDHETLVKMLTFKRFDYMPRSLHEIWAEVAEMDNLTVEETLAIYYPSPFYFFVNNDNDILHNRISVGLSNAIDNGSFHHFFENHPSTKSLILNAKLEQRTVFKLKNRFMTEETKAVISDVKYLYRPALFIN